MSCHMAAGLRLLKLAVVVTVQSSEYVFYSYQAWKQKPFYLSRDLFIQPWLRFG